MTTPDGEVELRDLDTEKLTIDELTLMFDPGSLEGGEVIGIFRRFCLQHTNWTRQQVGKITAGEMQAVMDKFSQAIKELAVPKETPPVSEPGPTATT